MMGEFLLSSATAPFTFALALLFGLLALEVVAALVGGTILGFGADAGAGPDFDAGLDGSLDADLDADPDLTEAEPGVGEPAGGLSALLGLGQAPFMVWLAMLLTGFGLTGLAVQTVAGSTLPAVLAAIPAGAAGLVLARQASAAFARLLPKTETTALETRQLGRTRGVVTQGTATRGRPAEVRITDRHGNVHYLRAEPAHDGDAIAQGTEVIVRRDPRTRGFRLVPLSEAPLTEGDQT